MVEAAIARGREPPQPACISRQLEVALDQNRGVQRRHRDSQRSAITWTTTHSDYLRERARGAA